MTAWLKTQPCQRHCDLKKKGWSFCAVIMCTILYPLCFILLYIFFCTTKGAARTSGVYEGSTQKNNTPSRFIFPEITVKNVEKYKHEQANLARRVKIKAHVLFRAGRNAQLYCLSLINTYLSLSLTNCTLLKRKSSAWVVSYSSLTALFQSHP